jgi:hypothetical protein
MVRVRAVLSWAFVRGPAAAYELADSGSSLFSLGVLAAMVLFAALGAGTGAVVGLLTGGSVSDAALVGAAIGFGTVVAWLLLILGVVAVLWIRGTSPAETASGRKPAGRHAASDGWRRRGQPLVPLSLVAFFALMTVALGADGGYSWHQSRPRSEPTAVVDGTVVAEREPGWFSRGSGSVVIRYTVGGVDYTVETGREPGDRVLRAGDVVPVEYVVTRAADGRSTWAVEAARSDGVFGLVGAAGCAGLGVVSGIGYLVGRWRSSGRRGG